MAQLSEMIYLPAAPGTVGPWIIRPALPHLQEQMGVTVAWKVSLADAKADDKIFLVDSQGKTWGFTVRDMLMQIQMKNFTCDLL